MRQPFLYFDRRVGFRVVCTIRSPEETKMRVSLYEEIDALIPALTHSGSNVCTNSLQGLKEIQRVSKVQCVVYMLSFTFSFDHLGGLMHPVSDMLWASGSWWLLKSSNNSRPQ